jgi:acylphosphatase
MSVTQHLRISGRVQGVGFRHYMTRQARGLGVTGWVHNRHDGSVEAMVQGTEDAVARLIEWARSGPPSARVTDVQVTEGSGSYTTFETRPTE